MIGLVSVVNGIGIVCVCISTDLLAQEAGALLIRPPNLVGVGGEC